MTFSLGAMILFCEVVSARFLLFICDNSMYT